MKSLPSRIASRYRQARDFLAEARTDIRIMFTQCQRGGLTIVVICLAGGFWIGVIVS